MNPKEQIPKLKKNIEWLLYQSIFTRQTFNAAYAVSQVFETTNALASYGDYFAYTQNIMIADVQLRLAKLFDNNKQSLSIPKVIDDSISLFTEKYYEAERGGSHHSFTELNQILTDQKKHIDDLSTPIKNLKVLRDKDLAHFDKSIGDFDKLEGISKNNPVYLSEAKELIDFAVVGLSKVKEVMFNVSPMIHERSYIDEVTEIAKAIEEYRVNKFGNDVGGVV